ncbi:Uncharacterised protein [uncultured archaeon]|nr:Uncharacterised protein [uncultured archaeon]
MVYSIEQFVNDCKNLGWYEGKVSPAWMDEMDIEPKKRDWEKVLKYKEEDNSIATILDYWKKDKGVGFRLSYMGHDYEFCFVDNTKDLKVYMKVVGHIKGFIPDKK